MREVMGVRLVLVKNPWAHKRWKGAYSVNDHARWTPALKAAIGVRACVCVRGRVFRVAVSLACHSRVFCRINFYCAAVRR